MCLILLLILAVVLSGCGRFDRFVVSLTGDAVETCHDGVTYLQFTSGATVKYNTDGTVAKCQ